MGFHCRVCDGTDLSLAVDLGSQPWGNDFRPLDQLGTEPFYPLRVLYCHGCQTAQLDVTVPKETMFGDHTYLSGTTGSLSQHFAEVARRVDERFFHETPGRSVLDIGSNDGTQLKHYQAMGYDVLGVESSKGTARVANEAGVPTVNEFFNLPVLRGWDRQFHVINASGVFFHLEELHSVCEAIREGLRNGGVLVLQFLYMRSIMTNVSFDQIYHEHLLYYNLATVERLLNRHGLALFDAEFSPIHGGSIIGYAGHIGEREASDRLEAMRASEEREGVNELAAYHRFAGRIGTMRERDLTYLEGLRQAGKRVYGLGAPVKGNTLLNHFGIGPDLLVCLTERNPLRKGLYSPGMHIPVVMEDEVEPPDANYVLAWNFRREILRRNQDLIDRGVEFYFPIEPQEDLA